MCHHSGPSDKSLLLQTVALFETLLSKIHQLQDENISLKTTQQDVSDRKWSNSDEMNKIHADRDQLILELEDSRNKLNKANQVIIFGALHNKYLVLYYNFVNNIMIISLFPSLWPQVILFYIP